MAEELFDEQERGTEIAKVSKEDRLLEMVLEKGNIDVLERYIALRASEAERQSRILFEENFAKMRAELPAVVKNKEGAQGKYKYSPLESLQRLCDPIIFAHGFTYSWREEALDKGEGKRIWIDIVGYGHTKSNYFDAPQIDPVTSRDGAEVQNLIQVRGVMSTYGRRYTFVAGFGIIIEGEDSDGQIPDDTDLLEVDLREFMKSGKISPEACALITKELMQDSPNIEKLKAYYKRARAKVAGK